MAGLLKRKDWYCVRFVDPERTCRIIPLGTKPEFPAERVKRKIEILVASIKTGEIIDAKTKVWLSK